MSQVEPADFAPSFYKRIFGYDSSDDGGLASPHLAYYIKEISGIDIHVQSVQDGIFASADICTPERYHRYSFFHLITSIISGIFHKYREKSLFLCEIK